MKAEVRVSKSTPTGVPLVQVAIREGATPDEIAHTFRAIYTSPEIYNLAGLKACLICKSGLDVGVVGSFGEVVVVNTEE